MTTAELDLSIVVASYNGAHVLEDGVRRIREVLDSTRYSYEIVFVDDASKDESPQIIAALCREYDNCRVLQHPKNTGRGKTVSDGIEASMGRIVGFIDIDLATGPIYIPALVSEVQKGADVALAWRIYKLRPRIAFRWMLSRGYHFLFAFITQVPILDSETGCKFFSREAILPILKSISDCGWFWDTEICVRSYYAGLKIVEVPTLFIRNPEAGSTVRVFRDSIQYFKKLLAFRSTVKGLREKFERRY